MRSKYKQSVQGDQSKVTSDQDFNFNKLKAWFNNRESFDNTYIKITLDQNSPLISPLFKTYNAIHNRNYITTNEFKFIIYYTDELKNNQTFTRLFKMFPPLEWDYRRDTDYHHIMEFTIKKPSKYWWYRHNRDNAINFFQNLIVTEKKNNQYEPLMQQPLIYEEPKRGGTKSRRKIRSRTKRFRTKTHSSA